MRYSLLSLVLLITVACVFFALVSYGVAATAVIGGPLAIALWEVVQLGRELSQPPSEP